MDTERFEEVDEVSFLDLSDIQREENVDINQGDGKTTSTPAKEAKQLCSECGVYVLNRNYKRHQKTHLKIRFKCAQCTMYFEDQVSLDTHRMRKHTVKNICNFCGSEYNQRSALNEHIRIKHEQTAKIFQCHVCTKQFNRLGKLQDHLNVHFNRKPYKCIHCKKSFCSKTGCSRHEKECKGTIRNRCESCSRIFSCSTALMDHRNSEHLGKKYVCKCGNAYKWRSGLARHKSQCK